jgi:hypothetical protein
MCFAAWRLIQAGLDADHLGTNFKALIRRAIYAGAAVWVRKQRKRKGAMPR